MTGDVYVYPIVDENKRAILRSDNFGYFFKRKGVIERIDDKEEIERVKTTLTIKNQNIMKKFIIINGTTTQIIERENLESAIATAQNICDHSKEIIVRKVNEFIDYSKVYKRTT